MNKEVIKKYLVEWLAETTANGTKADLVKRDGWTANAHASFVAKVISEEGAEDRKDIFAILALPAVGMVNPSQFKQTFKDILPLATSKAIADEYC
jgi:hypothetical protein